MDEQNQAMIVHFDPYGDRRIIVGSANEYRIYIVSSQAMSLASRPLNLMFASDTPFAQVKSVMDGTIEVSMPADDPDALLILVTAIHLKYDLMPQRATLDQLMKLAILCDKYDVAMVVQPWVPNLIRYVKEMEPNSHNSEKWLFVAWCFGLPTTFKRVMTFLIRRLEVSKDFVFTVEKRVLDLDSMPPGTLDSIVNSRNSLIDEILEICYSLIDRFDGQKPNVCKADKFNEFCDATVLGSLIRNFQRKNILPKALPSVVESSAEGLVTFLERMAIYTHPGHDGHQVYRDARGNFLHSRESCGLKTDLKQSVRHLVNTTYVTLLESQKRHLQIQYEQCRIEER